MKLNSIMVYIVYFKESEYSHSRVEWDLYYKKRLGEERDRVLRYLKQKQKPNKQYISVLVRPHHFE